ncbi:MFS transporter [Luteipulveratus mongoliensis]|uniref:Major facilitator superfamily (MFS) profile domain-containing protein n=1 Tax=Luteipulveratus mongoliensis TaxID=571913 RepID=A0A0K1JQ96_9MICO|nr:MFS transporter [Luteipulveratus mongoliensis]AKU18896.1 hypothetical protein VV02_12925 [Luteipulveratus mongoliensis]
MDDLKAATDAATVVRPRLTLAVLCAGMFLVLFDVTVVNVALPSMVRTFGDAGIVTQGVVVAYTVPLAALLLSAGGLVDRWTSRRVLIGGLALFVVGSVAATVAWSVLPLLLARAVQGVGAAGMLPAGLASVSELWPEPRARARAIATWSAVSASALAAGPLIGGELVELLGWRSIFGVTAVIAVVAATATWTVLPARTTGSRRRVDVAGSLLAAVALALLVSAAVVSRDSARGVVLLLVACGLVTVVLVCHERRAAQPLVPRELWHSRPLFGSCSVALLMNLVGNGTLLLVTLLLQGVQHRSAAEAGLSMVPFFVPLAVAPLVLRRWAAHVKPAHVVRLALALGVAGQLCLLSVTNGSGLAMVLVAMVLVGTCLGLLVPPLVTVTMAAAPALPGLAGALSNASRQVGTSLGVAVLGAVGGPARALGFVPGLHRAALVSIGLWVLAACIPLGDEGT